jgi:hypothetical protein
MRSATWRSSTITNLVRKRVFLRHFTLKMHHFTKTGSGQTQGKFRKGRASAANKVTPSLGVRTWRAFNGWVEVSKNGLFEMPFIYFYQDRLGTNIGKAQKKTVFPQENWLFRYVYTHSARACACVRGCGQNCAGVGGVSSRELTSDVDRLRCAAAADASSHLTTRPCTTRCPFPTMDTTTLGG